MAGTMEWTLTGAGGSNSVTPSVTDFNYDNALGGWAALAGTVVLFIPGTETPFILDESTGIASFSFSRTSLLILDYATGEQVGSATLDPPYQASGTVFVTGAPDNRMVYGSAPFADFVAGLDSVLINGSAFGDYIDASYFGVPVSFNGSDGNDTFYGQPGGTTDTYVVDAGEGDDYVSTSGFQDSIIGGNGADTIYNYDYGTQPLDADTILGGAGNDSITTSGGDRLEGGEGADTLQVSSGVVGVDGPATLIGGNGDDNLSAFWTASLDGGEGADTLMSSSEGSFTLSGGIGNDSLIGYIGTASYTGGAGDDTIADYSSTDGIAFYSGLRSDYAIREEGGSIIIQDLRAGSPDGTDTLLQVETAQFADRTINLANTAPAGQPDNYVIRPGETLTVAAPGVLANDVDSNLDPLTAILLTQPTNGTLTFAANGSFTYTPAAGFTGYDYFTYTQKDEFLTGYETFVQITVDAPPVIWSGNGEATAQIPIYENTNYVTQVYAIDSISGINYSIAGGADANLFQIDSQTGSLAFVQAPDYEVPNANNGVPDQLYQVVVRATDSLGQFDEQAIDVTVLDLPETLEITTDGGSFVAPGLQVEENFTGFFAQMTASSATAGTVTWSLGAPGEPGYDTARFSIDPVTGVLSLNEAQDFETGGDGGDNLMLVKVVANDGTASVAKNIWVGVTDVPEGPLPGAPTVTPAITGRGPDLLTNGPAGSSLLLNNGDGTFSSPALTLAGGGYIYGIATGDLDGDGRTDVVLTGDNGFGRIYLNDGDGTFTPTAQQFAGAFQTAARLQDIDGDGDLDLALRNQNGNLNVYKNDGSAGFTLSQQLPQGGFTFGDFNRDGFADILQTDQARLYLNDGTGTFVAGPVVGTPGETYGPAAGDIDGDGDVDAIVGVYNSTSYILENNGDGTFTQRGIVTGAPDAGLRFGGTLGDIDGDGDLDLTMSGVQQTILRNDGTGHFTVSQEGLGGGVFGDVDRDGDLDLVGTTEGVLLNNGSGLFTPAGGPTTPFLIDVEGVGENAPAGTIVASVVASDPDGDPLTYAITGGDPDGLFVIDGTGVIRLAPGQRLDYETAPRHDLEVTVTDPGGLTASTTVTVTVLDANDPLVEVSSETAASVDEDAPLALGTIVFADQDLADVHGVRVIPGNGAIGQLAVSLAEPTASSEGILTWTFSAPDGAFNFLGDGQTRTETFTVELRDGNGGLITRQIEVTVNGTGDAASVTVVPVEDVEGNAAQPAPESFLIGNQVTVADPDTGDLRVAYVAGSAQLSSADATGDVPPGVLLPALVTIDPGTGLVSYDRAAFDFLTEGATVTYTIEFNAQSGADILPRVITLTIGGLNDAVTVAPAEPVTFTGAVPDAPISSYSGSIAFTDPDFGDVHSVSVIASSGDVGAFTFNTNIVEPADGQPGAIQWTLEVDSALIGPLGAGEALTVTYSLLVSDGAGSEVVRDLVLTVEGTNDDPVVSATVDAGSRTEDDAPVVIDLIANATDPDLTDVLVIEGGGEGITVNVVSDNWNNPVRFTLDGTDLTVDPGQFNGLAAGEEVVLSFDYVVSDQNGGTAPASATVRITGTNDGPIARADAFTGDLDLVTGGFFSNLRYFANDGTGQFSSIGPAGFPTLALAAGDIDGDGDTDFVNVAPSSSGTAFINNGSGGFSPGVIPVTPANKISLADIDKDSDLDVVAFASTGTQVALNNGSGQFTLSSTVAAANGGAVADMNGDGHLDLVIGTPGNTGRLQVLAGDGTGSFAAPGAPFGTPGSYYKIAAADFDGDGALDILASSLDVGERVYLQRDGGFEEVPLANASSMSTGAEAADVDGDGDVDLILADYINSRISIRLNDGSASFTAGQTINVQPAYLWDVVVGDVNGDGALDLVATPELGPVQVLLNSGAGQFAATGQGLGSGAYDRAGILLDLDRDGYSEDATTVLRVLDNDSDPDRGAVLTIQSLSPSALGAALTISADGRTVVYDPTASAQLQSLGVGAKITDTFTYTVTDGISTSTATVSVVVAGRNDAPVVSQAIVVGPLSEDAPVEAVNLLAFASDVDAGDVVSVKAGSLSYAVSDGTWAAPVAYSVSPTGVLSIDPGQFNALGVGEQVAITFTYVVTDGNGGEAQTTATVTITGANDAPVITSNGGQASAFLTVAENIAAVTTVVAQDPDGSGVTYSIAGGFDGNLFTIDETTGALTWLQAPDYENPDLNGGGFDQLYDVIVRATDAAGAFDDQLITIQVTDVPGVVITGTGAGDRIDATTSVAGQPRPTLEGDTINGAGGNDTIDGLAGNDDISGGSGNDIINGGDDADRITGGSGTDQILGGAGNDTIVIAGTDGQLDVVSGGDGFDAIQATAATVVSLNGFNAGTASIERWIGNGQGVLGSTSTTTGDVFDLSALTVVSGLAFIDGQAGNDTLVGSDIDDGFYVEDLRGGAGADSIAGGAGGDRLTGGAGATTIDVIDGGAGNDTIVIAATDAQADVMNGGEGVDALLVSGGTVTLNGFDAAASSIESWLGSGQSLSGTTTNNLFDMSGLTTVTGLTFVDAGSGNDTIIGSDVDNPAYVEDLRGGAGADSLQGGGGSDRLTGGAGATTIDIVDGGAGNDTIVIASTDAQVDVMSGGEGTDALQITGGNVTLDTFDAAAASIEVWLGSGQALLGNATLGGLLDLSGLQSVTGLTYVDGQGGNDTIIGSDVDSGSYVEDLRGGAGADSLSGGMGADRLAGGTGATTVDVISGGGGNDTILFGGTDAQSDIIDGGAGTDAIQVTGTAAVTLNGFDATAASIEAWIGNGAALLGAGANDVFDLSGLVAVTGLSFVDGGTGADTIIGSSIDNGIYVEDLRGGAGADSLFGGAGADRLTGGIGATTADTVFGGAGNDTILLAGTDAQIDVIDGGDGIDAVQITATGAVTITGFHAGNVSIESWIGFGTGNLLQGSDAVGLAEIIDIGALTSITGLTGVSGRSGNDTIGGSAFADSLSGGNNDDLLMGRVGNDTLDGGAGADRLFGDEGNDSLTGGSGNDTLVGGAGSDVLTGGTNADMFVLQLLTGEPADVLTDFQRGLDKVQVDAASLGLGYTGALLAIDIVANATGSATTADGQFIYNTTTRMLSWDVDGTGQLAAVDLATFNATVTTLAASDVLLI